jgi:hypothetical protein
MNIPTTPTVLKYSFDHNSGNFFKTLKSRVDQYFADNNLDGLAKKVFEFGNKRVREHFEDINGFLRNKKMENLKEIERTVKT